MYCSLYFVFRCQWAQTSNNFEKGPPYAALCKDTYSMVVRNVSVARQYGGQCGITHVLTAKQAGIKGALFTSIIQD